jgi:hypothetical protein
MRINKTSAMHESGDHVFKRKLKLLTISLCKKIKVIHISILLLVSFIEKNLNLEVSYKFAKSLKINSITDSDVIVLIQKKKIY